MEWMNKGNVVYIFRRIKSEVLDQLPSKRRQTVCHFRQTSLTGY